MRPTCIRRLFIPLDRDAARRAIWAASCTGDPAIRNQVRQQAGTPDHPILIGPAEGRIRVRLAGRIVADSDAALQLTEASHAPVFYLPPDHVDFTVLKRSDYKTRCPYKGEASHYSIHLEGRTAHDAAWCYEHPLDAVSAIAGYLAFYPDRVDSIEELSGPGL